MRGNALGGSAISRSSELQAGADTGASSGAGAYTPFLHNLLQEITCGLDSDFNFKITQQKLNYMGFN